MNATHRIRIYKNVHYAPGIEVAIDVVDDPSEEITQQRIKERDIVQSHLQSVIDNIREYLKDGEVAMLNLELHEARTP